MYSICNKIQHYITLLVCVPVSPELSESRWWAGVSSSDCGESFESWLRVCQFTVPAAVCQPAELPTTERPQTYWWRTFQCLEIAVQVIWEFGITFESIWWKETFTLYPYSKQGHCQILLNLRLSRKDLLQTRRMRKMETTPKQKAEERLSLCRTAASGAKRRLTLSAVW